MSLSLTLSNALRVKQILEVVVQTDPPVNTVAPAVTGTAKVGSVLSCDTGTWDNAPVSYAYQWQRGGVDIGSATANTYTLVAADDLTNVRCVVTATNLIGDTDANSNAVAVTYLTPVNTVAPAVTGTAKVGSVLSCSTGTWDFQSSLTLTYQWQRNGANIGSATANTYTLVASDDLTNVRCVVTGTNSGGATAANSNAVAVTYNAPANTVAPAITGTGYVGQTLTTTNGTWDNSPTSYAYQWKDAGSNISGATSSTYVVTAATHGGNFTCEVTATNSGGSVAATSNVIHNWIPTDAANAAGWWAAWDASTITSSAGAVSAINDKATSKTLSQATGTNQPLTGTRTLNGLNVLDHDGDDRLATANATWATDRAVFAVAAIDAINNGSDGVFNFTGTNSFALDAQSATQFNGRVNVTVGVGADVNLTGFPHAGPSIYNANFDFTGAAIYNAFVDGTQRAVDTAYTGALTTLASFQVFKGSNNNFPDGYWGEMIVYDAVSATDRVKIEGYLAHTWGLTANLPGGHAHKTTAPTV